MQNSLFLRELRNLSLQHPLPQKTPSQVTSSGQPELAHVQLGVNTHTGKEIVLNEANLSKRPLLSTTSLMRLHQLKVR